MIFPHISSREKRWLMGVVVLLLFISSLPYLSALQAQTPEQIFSGAVFNRPDHSVYISAMHDGAHGNLIYRFKFTAEPHEAAYLRLFYHLIGFVGGLFHIAPQLTFHIFRLIFGAFALITIYLLSSSVFASVRERQFAFGVISTGAGLGWLKILLGNLDSQLPVDFWIPEAYTLFSIFVFPHFAAVTACIILAITLFIGYTKTQSLGTLTLIIILGLFVQEVNPLAPFIIGISLFGISLSGSITARRILWREAIALGLIAISFIPQFLYQQSVLQRDPIWAGYAAQNLVLSPPISEYLWGFGLLIFFALFGTFSALQTPSRILHASSLWIITVFIAAYMPVVFQRRFLHGVTIPLGLLTTQGVFGFIIPLMEKRTSFAFEWIQRYVPFTLFSLLSLSTIILIAQLTLFAARRPDSIFDPVSTVQAVDWLETHANNDDVVLCNERTAQIVAERSGLIVYFGHWIETNDFQRKEDELTQFYTNELPNEWITESGVRWVIVDPTEETFIPSDLLELVYDEDNIRFYQVK